MIRFRAVSKTFPDGTIAVGDLNLEIQPRQVTVLVGSSGSGKTTILRMINRMVEPTSGVIEIDDVDVATRPAVPLRRGIGYVMQSAGLLPHRRVIDNVTTVLRLNGADRADARLRGLELMDTVGLDRSMATRYPAQLSGGQQQRVGVARALSTDPNILLMDEPFGAVDPIVRTELQDELLRIQASQPRTIVFVTHDIDEAFRLGDHVVILATGGEIVQQGSPTDILAAPANGFVANFIGAERGRRALHLVERDGRRVVVDGDGRPAGILADGAAPAGGPAHPEDQVRRFMPPEEGRTR